MKKSTNFLMFNPNSLPNFIEEFVGSTAKTLDKLDVMDNDGWLSSIPFGKLASFMVGKLVEKPTPEQALSHAVGFACGLTFRQALLRLKVPLYLSEKQESIFKQQVKDKLNNQSVNLGAFDEHDFWQSPLVQEMSDFYLDALKKGRLFKNNQHRVRRYMQHYSKAVFVKLVEGNEKVYQKLTQYLSGKTYEEVRKLYLKERYQSDLKNLYHEVTLNDEKGMQLSDVYIEPKFGVYSPCLPSGNYKTGNHSFVKQENIKEETDLYTGTLHSYAEQYLQAPSDTFPRTLLIYGYPGQGKTSFCKRLLFDILDRQFLDREVYFIRFRNIDKPEDLKNNALSVLRTHLQDYYELELSKKEAQRAVFILDGLDELKMKGNFSDSDLEAICKHLMECAERWATMNIIITSRYGYVRLNQLSMEDVLVLQIRELALDQQLNWLSKYKTFHPESAMTEERLKKINKKNSYLKELITQPILLHMIAELEEEIDKGANRAKVYEQLFDQLTHRKWAKKQITSLQFLKKKPYLLRNYIRELAFEIYKSPNEYLHKSTIEQLDITDKFKRNLGQTDFKTALRLMMVAFYFQEVKRQEQEHQRNYEDKDEYAIEFLHKSLQEYLTAEKIWHTFRSKFLAKSEYDYALDDKKGALELLENLFADRILNKEVQNYLIEIIQNDDTTDKKTLADRLSQWLGWFLQKDFLHTYQVTIHNHPMDRAMGTFYGYWTVLSHLQEGRNYLENKVDREKFVYLLKSSTFQEIASKYSSSMIYDLYILLNTMEQDNFWLNLVSQNLNRANLQYANLQYANLNNANLQYANLQYANLNNANLQDANLNNANLQDAKLQDANLQDANLNNANLQDANLNNANLNNANLQDANLQYAKLQDAKLQDANLQDANLQDANLNRAKLQDANLQDANLQDANLNRAKLQDAKLQDAKLNRANLQDAKLQDANLNRANLQDANLQDVNLNRAKLQDANLMFSDFTHSDLKYTTLEQANLMGANLSKVKNLTIKQLSTVTTLYQCKGLSEHLKNQLKKEGYQKLLERPKEEFFLEDVDLSNKDLTDFDFQASKLYKVSFKNCNVLKVNFNQASLAGVNFKHCKNLTYEQLAACAYLYDYYGIEADILEKLKKEQPDLFQKPADYDEDILSYAQMAELDLEDLDFDDFEFDD